MILFLYKQLKALHNGPGTPDVIPSKGPGVILSVGENARAVFLFL